MSTKILYSLSDENPDLQKQIGCMNGIFHIFDRYHFLSSRRLAHHNSNQKRLPPGQNEKHERRTTHSTGRKTEEKNLKKNVKEKKRASTESSGTSLSSSSCSSTISSQPEPSFSVNNFPGTPSRDLPVYQVSDSPRLGLQHVDLRSVVKDSMYREARELPIKENAGGQVLKYMDSPRPLHLQQLKKAVNSRVSGLNESFQVLPPRKDVFLPRDGPRFSYDGRDSRDASKSTMKVKELPRLSLDSRVRSMKGSNAHLLEDQQRRTNSNMDHQLQEPGSHRRSSSVVAKLMGLEAFPEPTLENGSQPGHVKTFSDVERSSVEIKQNRLADPTRNSRLEGVSPRKQNGDSAKKSLASSKFPIETAPWRHQDGNKGHPPVSRSRETSTRLPNSSVTVYGEIEKRLTQLEFNKSGKDLRALKQILEAMQKTKEMSESSNDHVSSQSDNSSSFNQSSKLEVKGSDPSSTAFRGANSPKCFKSQIVIMKAAKPIDKASNAVSAATDNTKDFANKLTAKDRNPGALQLREPSSRLVHLKKKNNNAANALESTQISRSPRSIKSVKRSEPVNPRLQQKKQSHTATPKSSDLGRARKDMAKSGSPPRKSPDLQQKGARNYSISNHARDLYHQDDATSLKSESNISMRSYIDSEVTSADRSDKDLETWYNDHKSTPEAVKVGGEQPSPVSVLDATFYRDEPPSPVKKISPVFRDEDALSSDEAEWRPRDLNQLSSFGSDKGYRKQNLMHLYPTHKDEFGLLNNSLNSDHRYIAEILLASDLLNNVESGFTSFRHHPVGMINPNLFLALEKNKSSTRTLNAEHKDKRTINSEIGIERAQRKLIFDAVNEIIVHKSSYNQCISSSKQVTRVQTPQQLLNDLCTEVDRLQAYNSKCSLVEEEDDLRNIIWEDLNGSMDWTNGQSELSRLALDVERLIFKDLVTELVRDETSGRLCRQLFSK